MTTAVQNLLIRHAGSATTSVASLPSYCSIHYRFMPTLMPRGAPSRTGAGKRRKGVT